MSKRSRKTSSARSSSRQADSFKKNAVQALFFLNAILWFLYAFYVVFDMNAIGNSGFSVAAVGFFIIVVAGTMLAAGIWIIRVQKQIYYFALGITALNVLLSLTNLTDFFYIAALILDLLILWILFALRKSYLPTS